MMPHVQKLHANPVIRVAAGQILLYRSSSYTLGIL
jgi:hypothetical protein